MKKHLATGLVLVSCMIQLCGMNKSPNAPTEDEERDQDHWLVLHNGTSILASVYLILQEQMGAIYQDIQNSKDSDLLRYIKYLADNQSLTPFARAPELQKLLSRFREKDPRCNNLDIQRYISSAIRYEDEQNRTGKLIYCKNPLISPDE
jgi:hypothetical protein